MKNILTTIVLTLFAIFFVSAQPTQSGYVKTKGRMDSKGQLIPGTRIGGAAITLTGGHSTVADANGNFKLTVPDKKYYLKNVQKQGYVLVDPEVLSKQYVQSSNPLVITMETPEKQLEDQLKSERKLRKQLQKQLQQREDEIDSLKENNIITAEEYRAALQKLYADQESNEKLISDMAKRYAEIDYDLLDEFYRQVTFCIENGDLMKADSLLRSRGDVVQQVKDVHNKAQAINEEKEKIRQAETVLAADIEELARRCYSYWERFSRVNSDSAFFYITCRADLDTTNYEWQMDVFHKTFRSKKTLPYVLRALRIALTQYGEFHPVVAEIYISISKCDEKNKEVYWLDKAFEIYNLRADLEKMAKMYQLYGQAYWLDDYNKALAYYNKALETFKQMLVDSVDKKDKLYETIGDVYKDIGDVYKSKEKYIKAIQYYQMADSLNEKKERIDPRNICWSIHELYGDMGDCYVEMEKYDQAVRCFQRVLSLNCISEETRYYKCLDIGNAYMLSEQFDSAIVFFQKSLLILQDFKIKDLSQHCYVCFGKCYHRMGNELEAVLYYEKAVNESPDGFYKALLLSGLGDLYAELGDFDNAENCYRGACNNYEHDFNLRGSTRKSTKAKMEMEIGSLYASQHDTTTAMIFYRKVIDEYKELGDNFSIAKVFFKMSEMFFNIGEYAEALDYGMKSLDFFEEGDDLEMKAYNYRYLGIVYARQIKYEEAKIYITKAMNVYNEMYGKINTNTASCLNDLGTISFYQRSYDKAIDYCQASISICKAVYGENNTMVAERYVDLGDIYSAEDNHYYALESYRRASDIFSATSSKKTPVDLPRKISLECVALAEDYYDNNDYAKAINAYRYAMDIYNDQDSLSDRDKRTVGKYCFKVGRCYYRLYDYSGALEYFTKALSIFENDDVEYMIWIYTNLGYVYSELSDNRLAVDSYQKAIGIIESEKQRCFNENEIEDHDYCKSIYADDICNINTHLGDVYADEGDFPEALNCYDKAKNIYSMYPDEMYVMKLDEINKRIRFVSKKNKKK